MRCSSQNSHDVVHDQEVAGETQLLDDIELVLDLPVRAGNPLGFGRAVAVGCLAFDQGAEPAHLGVVRRNREVGQLRRDHLEVERALLREFDGPLQHAGVPAQPVAPSLPRS